MTGQNRIARRAGVGALALLGVAAAAHAEDSKPSDAAGWREVSGEGVHYFSTAVLHSETTSQSGKTTRSTETVELTGDLIGRVLYHPVTEIDFEAQTLSNTGHQVFSGTVLGGPPVLLYDDKFHFTVNLATGETVGEVVLDRALAGPAVECRLAITGDGARTDAGDSLVRYEGKCRTPAE